MLCPVRREERRAQLERIRERYRPEDLSTFQALVEALGEQINQCFEERHYEDILGKLYEELDLANEWHGQFFTPQIVADFMGRISAGSNEQALLKQCSERGYITVCEPCVGSGAMLLGLANAYLQVGGKPQTQLVATCTDVDLRCIHMAYIQLSLYGIPAVLIHGNSLSKEEWSRWYTPLYIADKWIWRQTGGMTSARNQDDELLKMADEPMYAVLRALDSMGNEGDHKTEMHTVERTPTAAYDIQLREDKNGQTALF